MSICLAIISAIPKATYFHTPLKKRSRLKFLCTNFAKNIPIAKSITHITTKAHTPAVGCPNRLRVSDQNNDTIILRSIRSVIALL